MFNNNVAEVSAAVAQAFNDFVAVGVERPEDMSNMQATLHVSLTRLPALRRWASMSMLLVEQARKDAGGDGKYDIFFSGVTLGLLMAEHLKREDAG